MRGIPQGQHFAQHSHAIAHEVDFASLAMIPAHRDLAQPQSRAMSEEEKFYIKSESVHFSGRDNLPADGHVKRFEAALGIPEWKAGSGSRQQIKNAPGLFPPPWLSISNQAAIERARAEDQVGVAGCDRLDDFRKLVDWSGQVGIEERCDGSCRAQESAAHSGAFAAIGGMIEQTNRQRRFMEQDVSNNFAGPVGRAVVHDDQLTLRTIGAQVFNGNAQGFGNALRFVERGHDE